MEMPCSRQTVDDGEQDRCEVAGAHVDADGERGPTAPRSRPGCSTVARAGAAGCRRFVAEILECLQRRRFAGTGEAGDQQERAAAVRRAAVRPRRQRRLSDVICCRSWRPDYSAEATHHKANLGDRRALHGDKRETRQGDAENSPVLGTGNRSSSIDAAPDRRGDRAAPLRPARGGRCRDRVLPASPCTRRGAWRPAARPLAARSV